MKGKKPGVRGATCLVDMSVKAPGLAGISLMVYGEHGNTSPNFAKINFVRFNFICSAGERSVLFVGNTRRIAESGAVCPGASNVQRNKGERMFSKCKHRLACFNL